MIGRQLQNGKSYFTVLVDCLEHGMPLLLETAMIRQYAREIKYARHSSKDCSIYMGDLGWGYVYDVSQKLSEKEILTFATMLVTVKERLSKGATMESLNYKFEDKYFKQCSGKK